MKLRTISVLFLCLACSLFAFADPPEAPPGLSPSPAQPAQSAQPVQSVQPVDAAVPPVTQPRDPTQPDAALARILSGGQPSGAKPLTQITRLGLIVVAGQPPEALIMVKGVGSFIVHEGSTLTVGEGNSNAVLRVARLTAETLEISVNSQNQKMIVR